MAAHCTARRPESKQRHCLKHGRPLGPVCASRSPHDRRAGISSRDCFRCEDARW
jgi:hypothetical protein